MKQLLIILFLFIAISSLAQNILISDSAFSRPRDTVAISIEINNSNPFISFQFDLQMPAGTEYVGNSLNLSNRSTNHVAVVNLVENDILRILAYSPNNEHFLGASGKVLSFKLALGNLRGEYPLTLSNAIIGDSLSKNILTGLHSGLLSVFPTGMNENSRTNPGLNFNVFPNPVGENPSIEFSLNYPSKIEITLNDNLGRKLFSEPLGEFGEGFHRVTIPGQICSGISPGTLYHLGLEVTPQKMSQAVVYKKIFK
jgi:hypothetical protein